MFDNSTPQLMSLLLTCISIQSHETYLNIIFWCFKKISDNERLINYRNKIKDIIIKKKY
jgi:hypothetical protein